MYNYDVAKVDCAGTVQNFNAKKSELKVERLGSAFLSQSVNEWECELRLSATFIMKFSLSFLFFSFLFFTLLAHFLFGRLYT